MDGRTDGPTDRPSAWTHLKKEKTIRIILTADVVTKYAIHNSGKGFTLKKAGDSNTDVKTAVGASICDNIRNIYGGAVAKELIPVPFSVSGDCYNLYRQFCMGLKLSTVG